jgi:lipoprotein-anchoring transpeptidase ErfK/SrfK
MRRVSILAVVLVWGVLAAPAQAKNHVTPTGRDRLSERAIANHRAAQARAERDRVEATQADVATTARRDQRWIEVRLSTQQLIAWENGRVVMNTAISSGTRATPTVRGQFRIGRKFDRIRMRGADYDLPNVPYAMFFYRDYAIHGTYWHTSFGRPMSHGCVNMPTDKAKWLYQWAAPGTLVVVH